MKTKKDYNYKQYSILFDCDFDEEKELVDWIEKNKKKKNGYCVIFKKALKYYIDKVEKDSE